jgi:hypothetical protein
VIPHHATFLEWSHQWGFGRELLRSTKAHAEVRTVNASQDAASLTEILRFPTRPFKVSDCPPATLILIAAFTSLSWKVPQKRHSHSRTFNAFFPPIFPQQEHL